MSDILNDLNLPEWFDLDGRMESFGDDTYIIHPLHKPHKLNRDTKEWEPIEVGDLIPNKENISFYGNLAQLEQAYFKDD